MYKIVICIPTYRRQALLSRLVKSISDCDDYQHLVSSLSVLVVDNDAEMSAMETVSSLKKELDGRLTLYYHSYSEKGLANVRNELLRESLRHDPDFIVFIDDDEYVTVKWLAELIKTITVNNADAARGPVFAEAESEYPSYIWSWFKRENYPDGSEIGTFTTGNLILRVSALKKYDVWFDNRFNTTGFEDSYFGIQMIKRGARIYWSANAVTYELIPSSRANLRWIMLRTYNGAATYTYMLKLERQYPQLVRKIAVSVINIAIGTLASALVMVPFRKRYWGPVTIAEGLGGFAGLMSLKYNEYR